MAGSPEGGTTGQRARSKRVVNEEIVQDRAPDLDIRLRALVVPWRCGLAARRRLGTRLGLAGGGPIAFALPAHATPAGTQNPRRFCPQEPFQQP